MHETDNQSTNSDVKHSSLTRILHRCTARRDQANAKAKARHVCVYVHCVHFITVQIITTGSRANAENECKCKIWSYVSSGDDNTYLSHLYSYLHSIE